MRREMVFGLAMMIGTSGCVSANLAGRTNDRSFVIRGESDRLNDLESAVQGSDSSTPPMPKSEGGTKCSRCGNKSCTCSSQGESTEENSIFGQIALQVLGLPFKLPIAMVHDDYDHYTEFPDFPYAEDVPGSLLIDNCLKCKKQSWTANIQTFAIPGTDHVDRFGGRLVLDSNWRVGVDTEAGYWFRNHSDGNNTQAWIGDANLTFRFAESEHVQMRAGIGTNWLADQTKPEAGINFTYGFEWFPRKPWTVASVIDFGSLGAGTLFHNRSTIGVMIGPAEAFVGYDYFQISNVNIQGPVAGIGWRF